MTKKKKNKQLNILILGPNQNKSWNCGHQHFRNAIARHANVVFYGHGWNCPNYGLDVLNIIGKYSELSKPIVFDTIICEGPKYAGPFTNLDKIKDILKLCLCVDYTDLYKDMYNEYLNRCEHHFAIFHNYFCLENFGKSKKSGKVGGITNAWVIPFAVDTAIFHNMALPRKYDVGAIFSTTSWAYPLRGDIKKILRSSKYKTLVAGDPHNRILHKDYVRALNECKIFVNSNCNWGGLNMKYTEAMACGAMFLTDKPRDFDQSGFEDKKHLVLYSGLEDMMDKIEYYLKHDDKRKKIASAGMDFVRKTYSTDAMAKKLIKEIALNVV